MSERIQDQDLNNIKEFIKSSRLISYDNGANPTNIVIYGIYHNIELKQNCFKNNIINYVNFSGMPLYISDLDFSELMSVIQTRVQELQSRLIDELRSSLKIEVSERKQLNW